MKTNLNFLKNTYIAHRGLHDINKGIIENSISSIKNAIKYNYSIEIDIQMLKDKTLVVFHDYNLKRLCGVDINLKDITYDELLKYPYLNTNETIARLEDILKVVNLKVPLLIELKRNKHMNEMIEIFNNIMSKYNGIYAVFSFSPSVVKWYYKNNPSVAYGIISSYFTESKFPKIIKWYLKRLFVAKKYDVDFISYNIKNLPNKYVDKYKDNKIIISYTAESQKDFDMVKKYYDNVVFQNFIPK